MPWEIMANRIDGGYQLEILRRAPGGPYRVSEKDRRDGRVICDIQYRNAESVARSLLQTDEDGRRYMPGRWARLLEEVRDLPLQDALRAVLYPH